MPATTGMKGAGYYDQHSGAQMSGIEALQAWIDDAVANLPLPAPAQPVTVLDLGSSEGRNAIRLMGAIVAGLRQRPPGSPFRRSTATWPAITSTSCSPIAEWGAAYPITSSESPGSRQGNSGRPQESRNKPQVPPRKL